MDELLTIPQVAEVLKISKTNAYKLINSGLLPYLKLGNAKVRRKDLEDFMEKCVGKEVRNFEEVVDIG